MQKIISHTPPWLCRPSKGGRIFSDPEPQSPVSPSKRSSYFGNATTAPGSLQGPKRLIVSRGSEIFTVVGNKIRWASLRTVKDDWDERNHGSGHDDDVEGYRTLVTPVYYQITQLAISPSGSFLAICTEHTVHVAILPDSSRLHDKDRSPVKLKAYQLGPTTHVIPESPLASVIWHPLAASTASTDCLVTVTIEAAVRIWEIDRTNHWSFERPALAIDLRKLADGVSLDQDFEPLGFGKSRGFSVDAFDMEVSAACFGGRGIADEDGWAAMTLWTAMSNGDVYALCPILPSKWRSWESTISSLSVTAVSNICALDFKTAETDIQKAAEQQFEWVQEIDEEGFLVADSGPEIRFRPKYPSAIPRLQGPFEINGFDATNDGEVTDIHVIAARLDEEAVLSGEDDYEMITDGFQFTVVALSTNMGKVFVSVELEGISGQWLPLKGRSTFSVPISGSRDLILLEQLLLPQSSTSWPMFTSDSSDAYSAYITGASGVYAISLRAWATRVGIEANGEGEVDAGLQTRLATACQDGVCEMQELLSTNPQPDSAISSSPSAPTVVQDFVLGQIVLTYSQNQPYAVLIDEKKAADFGFSTSLRSSTSPLRSSLALAKVLEEDVPDLFPTRAPYVPAEVFYKNHMTPLEDMKQRFPPTRRSIFPEKPLRLSPACLDVMTLAHRTFSQQTATIEKAAAELFRRCERLREELADQVKQMSELADRLQHSRSSARSDNDKSTTFEGRLSSVQERHKELLQRYERVRRKSGRIGTANKELSTKERAWMDEIETLAQRTGISTNTPDGLDTMADRYESVSDSALICFGANNELQIQQFADDLLEQSKLINLNPPRPETDVQQEESPSGRKTTLPISSRLQRERVTEVMLMVERQGAVIDAVSHRLSKLSSV